MQLADWLASKAMDKDDFARRVGATPEAVRLWTAGSRIPNRHFMKKIVETTAGAVRPDDFFDVEAAQ